MSKNARHIMILFSLGGFTFLITTASPATAELINDPYVLNFADGAEPGSVALDVPANTGIPVIFDLSYGSWSISFVGQNLEVALTIDPMTGTGQLQPSVGAAGLDWTPIPGIITGFVRDPQTPSALFDLTAIGLPGSVSASSTSSIAFANFSENPSTVLWRWAIEAEHVPEPSALVTGLVSTLGLASFGRRRRRICPR